MSATEPRRTESLDEALLSAEFLRRPYPVYARLRREDPVHWMEAWNTWLITRFDDASSVLREDGRTFSVAGRVSRALRVLPEEMRAGLGVVQQHFSTGISFSDPPVHTHIRGVLNKAFSPRTIEGMRPRIEQRVGALLDAAGDGTRMDVVADFALPLPEMIIADVLGLPPQDLDGFRAWSDDLATFFGSNRQTSDTSSRGREALAHLRDTMHGLADERRQSPRDDVISRLVEAERCGEGLSEDEFLSTTVTFAVGGHKTTTALIGSGMWWLLREPDQFQRLRAEPGLMPTAVEEFLRLEAPTQRVTKIAIRDVEIGGRDAQLPRAGLREHVREDRDGVLPLHDPLDELKFLHEVVPSDEDFHGSFLFYSFLRGKRYLLYWREGLWICGKPRKSLSSRGLRSGLGCGWSATDEAAAGLRGTLPRTPASVRSRRPSIRVRALARSSAEAAYARPAAPRVAARSGSSCSWRTTRFSARLTTEGR